MRGVVVGFWFLRCLEDSWKKVYVTIGLACSRVVVFCQFRVFFLWVLFLGISQKRMGICFYSAMTLLCRYFWNERSDSSTGSDSVMICVSLGFSSMVMWFPSRNLRLTVPVVYSDRP